MNDEGRKERRKGVGERERGFVGTNAKSWDIWAWKGAPRAQRTAQAAEAALPPRVSLLPPLGVEALAVMGWGAIWGAGSTKPSLRSETPVASAPPALCIYPEPPPAGGRTTRRRNRPGELFLGQRADSAPSCSTLSPSCGGCSCLPVQVRFKQMLCP